MDYNNKIVHTIEQWIVIKILKTWKLSSCWKNIQEKAASCFGLCYNTEKLYQYRKGKKRDRTPVFLWSIYTDVKTILLGVQEKNKVFNIDEQKLNNPHFIDNIIWICDNLDQVLTKLCNNKITKINLYKLISRLMGKIKSVINLNEENCG